MADTRTVYKVVINHEEQYALWIADQKAPEGWSDTGKTGTQTECQDYIKKVWVDMRSVTLRKMLEDLEK